MRTADPHAQTLSEDPLGNLPLPPEIVTPELKELTAWDEAVGEAGHRVEPVPAEDESEFPEVLVEEGLDEADEEMRAMQDDAEAGETTDEEEAESEAGD